MTTMIRTTNAPGRRRMHLFSTTTLLLVTLALNCCQDVHCNMHTTAAGSRPYSSYLQNDAQQTQNNNNNNKHTSVLGPLVIFRQTTTRKPHKKREPTTRRKMMIASMLPRRIRVAERMNNDNNRMWLATSGTMVRGGSSEIESDTDSVLESEPEDTSVLSLATNTTKKLNESLKDKKRQFLDHIALVSSSFLNKEPAATLKADGDDDLTDTDSSGKHHSSNGRPADTDITPQTDLSLPGRHFHVVTTAALPWMTGTAVNPLLRAGYLHRRTQQINAPTQESSSSEINKSADTTTNSINDDNDSYATEQHQHERWVTLVIPWLELEEDQLELYGQVFDSPADQEVYIRDWLRTNAGMPDVADPDTGLKLLFYPARYHSGLRSIFAMGDICQLIIDGENTSHGDSSSDSDSTPPTPTLAIAAAAVTDVCILEEPEHCNWYRAPGDGWTQKFNYVVGIVHTNYKEYASAHYSGLWTSPAIALLSSAMVRAYCHQVIKLSDVLQTFATEKEKVSNVHGVRSDFLEIGVAARDQQQAANLDIIAASFASSSESDSEQDQQEEEVTTEDDKNDSNSNTKVYFIGKLLWAKGLDLMLEMEDYYKQCTGNYFPIDIYGSGPEQQAIRRAFWGRSNQPLNETAVNHNHTAPATEEQHKHQKHRRRHLSKARGRRRQKQKNQKFTSKASFQEHLQKIKESLPSAEDFRLPSAEDFRQLKESMSSVELPTTFHEWRRQPIPATFPGRVDHASLGQHANYSIFVNPSISEVLCTTTAEALAMGKFAIIPVHPSNAFFLKFPNCLAYRDKFEFAANLQWALTHDPEPLTPELAHEFTWEAATDRFLTASAVTWKEARERERLGLTKRDERIAWFLNELGKGPKGDVFRMILGAGPASGQVKYVLEQQSKLEDGEESEEGMESDDDEEDEGLTKKFHSSSFVQALRASLPSTLVGDREGI